MGLIHKGFMIALLHFMSSWAHVHGLGPGPWRERCIPYEPNAGGVPSQAPLWMASLAQVRTPARALDLQRRLALDLSY